MGGSSEDLITRRSTSLSGFASPRARLPNKMMRSGSTAATSRRTMSCNTLSSTWTVYIAVSSVAETSRAVQEQRRTRTVRREKERGREGKAAFLSYPWASISSFVGRERNLPECLTSAAMRRRRLKSVIAVTMASRFVLAHVNCTRSRSSASGISTVVFMIPLYGHGNSSSRQDGICEGVTIADLQASSVTTLSLVERCLACLEPSTAMLPKHEPPRALWLSQGPWYVLPRRQD